MLSTFSNGAYHILTVARYGKNIYHDDMLRIVVASKNPVKINAALIGFQRMFPEEIFEISGVFVASGVRDQPMDDAETLRGAHQRLEHSHIAYPDADFWVGIEGGVQDSHHGMQAFAWIVVQSQEGMIGRGKTGMFALPPRVADLVRQGKELGEADDIVFGRINSKQENGAVGILTDNIIHRERYYADTVVLALISFKNKDLYGEA